MSVIGYREWEVWQNTTYFASPSTLSGQFVFSISPGLMARQTVEFVFEQIEEIRANRTYPSGAVSGYLSPLVHPRPPTPDGSLTLYKVEVFNTADSIPAVLAMLLEELRALSLCVDFPLTCGRVEYDIPPGQVSSGTVFVALRKPLSRGLAFEVHEREAAADNLRNHFSEYASTHDPDALIATNHYLAGLTLLSLEDQSPGLLDGAFMQFYQACETLLLHGPRETVTDAKKRIASDPNVPNQRDMQILVAHVWKVRHSFFGHRGSTVPRTASTVYQIAKQVLVARWLCRRLIDLHTRGADGLCREMRFYQGVRSEEFRGTVPEVETTFAIPGADGERVENFDAGGTVIETYVMR